MSIVIDLTISEDESTPPTLLASHHGLPISTLDIGPTLQDDKNTSLSDPTVLLTSTRPASTLASKARRFPQRRDREHSSPERRRKRQRIQKTAWENPWHSVAPSRPAIAPSLKFSARARARIRADRQRTKSSLAENTVTKSGKQHVANAQVLREQIFPHIYRPLNELRDTVSAERRKVIGKETAILLCNDALLEDVDKHNGRLSNKFEQYVSRTASEYITGRIIEEESLRDTSQLTTTLSQTSSTFSEEDGVFGSTRQSSPINARSPTTSYSAHGQSDLEEGLAILKNAPNSSESQEAHNAVRTLDLSLTSPTKYYTDLLCDFEDYSLARDDSITERPYLNFREREAIARGLRIAHLSEAELMLLKNHVVHVAFSADEVRYTLQAIEMIFGFPHEAVDKSNMIPRLLQLLHGYPTSIRKTVKLINQTVPGRQLANLRTRTSVVGFLNDVVEESVQKQSRILRFRPRSSPCDSFQGSLNILLDHRHEFGQQLRPGCRPMTMQLTNSLEDSMEVQETWTNASGDICSITWADDGESLLCGAIAHSDAHNQQYNRPGNLLFRESGGTIHSISNHRIVRPVIEEGENSLAAMVQTQDPWLYTSVVFTSYSDGRYFTASFDKTVKVWAVRSPQSSLELLGSWEHEDNVDFVVTSPYHALVATASQASVGAVRVYEVNKDNVSASSYFRYGRLKGHKDFGASPLWCYYPATIAFGKAAPVSHLLLVGYSPRSVRNDEDDIPDDRKNTGELRIFDTQSRAGVTVFPCSQNVFEVVWHPSEAMFFAATSPSGDRDSNVRTQILIYAQSEGGYTSTRALDCEALDVNDLTVMPINHFSSYVTASCTNGSCYVWDTAQGDRPIHILSHGESIEPGDHERDREAWDVGIMFTAWGQTPARLYTGSSDGILKAWDVQAVRGDAHVRDVVELPGAITSGAFSPDFSELILGDSCGKVYKLDARITNPGEEPSKPVTRPIFPHKEPLPPYVEAETSLNGPGYASRIGRDASDAFIRSSQLIMHPSKVIGVYQGPCYRETGLVRTDLHVDYNPLGDLLPDVTCKIGMRQVEMETKEDKRLEPLSLPRIKNVIFNIGEEKTCSSLLLNPTL